MTDRQWHTRPLFAVPEEKPVKTESLFIDKNGFIFDGLSNSQNIRIFQKRILKLKGVIRRQKYHPPFERKELEYFYIKKFGVKPDDIAFIDLYMKTMTYNELVYLSRHVLGNGASEGDRLIIANLFSDISTVSSFYAEDDCYGTPAVI